MKHSFTIALAGNPNSGKSTIFNALTGERQHVGNYPGVTVEQKEGEFSCNGSGVRVIDLPGTYSLTASSPEERIARDVLIEEKPDLVVNIIDASNLERNLYLTMQLLEQQVPMLFVLNMVDTAKGKGLEIDMEKLGQTFGVPVVSTVAHRGKGIDKLKESIVYFAGSKPSKPYNWIEFGESHLSKCVKDVVAILKGLDFDRKGIPDTWYALKYMDGDSDIAKIIDTAAASDSAKIKEIISKLEAHEEESSEVLVAEHRYGVIGGACRDIVSSGMEVRRNISDKIDAIVTNRFLGIPLFLALMYVVFEVTFTLGDPLMELIETGFGWLAETIDGMSSGESMLKSLIVDGIIGGVGGVLVFLPNIVLLFLCIAILEGTGYMARAAFIMDRIMSKLGLHGKSFIPMLVGFGCSIPGIMATRTLESRRDRMTTMLVLPLMSCGARLQIYALIIPAFFPKSMYANIMWTIYVIGVLLAIGCAKILRSTLFKGEDANFVMELPPYRMPTIYSLLVHMWERSWSYLRKAGTLILAISVILWFASTYPKTEKFSKDYEGQIKAIEASAESKEVKEEKVTALLNEQTTEVLEGTISGKIGKGMEPFIRPLGFDWKVGTALVGALAAKEVFVSQMGIVYSLGEEVDAESEELRTILRNTYTPLQGFCMMLFCLISAPCLATIAVTRRESESWGWALFQLGGLTALAWVVTFIVYQGGMLLGIGLG